MTIVQSAAFNLRRGGPYSRLGVERAIVVIERNLHATHHCSGSVGNRRAVDCGIELFAGAVVKDSLEVGAALHNGHRLDANAEHMGYRARAVEQFERAPRDLVGGVAEEGRKFVAHRENVVGRLELHGHPRAASQ